MSRLNPTWIYSQLMQHKKQLISQRCFESTRSTVYGFCEQSFEGANQSHMIIDKLKAFYPGCVIPHFVMPDRNHHSIILWENHIIDPCWRETAYLRRGDTRKWFSPYASAIFDCLPPIMVLKQSEYLEAHEQLQDMRSRDVLHANDIIDFVPKINVYLSN